MADIVIFGAGRVASVAKVLIDAHGPDRIVGFTVDRKFKSADTFEGLPLVAWEALEERFPPQHVKLLGPLSSRVQNEFRRDRYLEGKRRGYRFTSFIHPTALDESESIGENAFIFGGVILEPFVRVGNSVILWSGSIVGHHATIEDYCFFGGRVTIGSGSTIGERTFLGSTTYLDGSITLGPSCFIGSAATIKRDLPAESVVIAVADPVKPYPSRRMRRIT